MSWAPSRLLVTVATSAMRTKERRMPMKTCNGAGLYYELSGEGAPVVLVHGGWIDAMTWELVVPAFAQHYQVLTYDRRGHSRSQRPGAGSRRHDEDDLIALLEALDLAPAHL